MYDMPKQSQGSEMKGCREKCDKIFCYGQTDGWPVRHLFLWKSQLKIQIMSRHVFFIR